jgi:hypothetical protein
MQVNFSLQKDIQGKEISLRNFILFRADVH